RRRKGLTQSELQAIAERCPDVKALAPIEPLVADLIKYGDQRLKDAVLAGATAGYETVHDLYVEKARFLTEVDVARAAHVAVVGADVVDALFPFVDPIDKDISIDGRRFRVVGVLERKGKILFFSRDNVVLVPLGAIQKRDPRFNFVVADAKAV